MIIVLSDHLLSLLSHHRHYPWLIEYKFTFTTRLSCLGGTARYTIEPQTYVSTFSCLAAAIISGTVSSRI